MLSGLHAPNSFFTEADYALTALARFKSAKLMWYHDFDTIDRLRTLGVTHFTVRLPDSVQRNVQGQEYVPSYWDYSDLLIERILYFFHGRGITDFQLDNEPNITWALQGFGPYEYRWFLQHTLGYLRPKVPSQVRLGFPPFSFADEYKPHQWLGPQIDTAPLFDFLCVNSYWQSSRQGETNILAGPMTWHQFGGNCQFYADWQSEMPLQLVEYGNSIHEQGVYRPEQVTAFRREQYPIYLRWLDGFPYIESAHVFIVGGSPTWVGFQVAPSVADAIGQYSLLL